ncbi:hypothetical protein [Inquilinus sp. CAU 1745]|uniref:hypothetical protein n=1 Tax=Inquilinus sp. CAU 1745 TaxID=3140369 RepID=UPI00325B2729
MTFRLLPIVLLLSGCAVADAFNTGVAAIADGTKYVVDRVSGEPAPADGSPGAPPPAQGTATGASGPTGGPTIQPAPAGTVETAPLN